ncbi:putative NOT transcription complex subunit VIP2 [Vitis vinifera]|uniref:Putative NOT transcription complex subunit VIP2 n=1 Tax=Vitis vinifera TaxID=29760 RepID=A0A438BZF7_VITVI|nr:putative NOT transcription complex subunit VIP2 [Vitis vinifera]
MSRDLANSYSWILLLPSQVVSSVICSVIGGCIVELWITNSDYVTGGNTDFPVDSHRKEQLHDSAVSMMQSQHFPMGRSGGFNLGVPYSSHLQQQQQHASSVGSGGPPSIGLRPMNSSNTISGVGPYDQLIQQYQQLQSQSQFRMGQMSAVGPHGDQDLKSQSPEPVIDEFGLRGLLKVIRMNNPDLTSLALGIDLTTLGLNLNASDDLHKRFASPWAEEPHKGEPQYSIPECYYAKQPPVLNQAHFAKLHLETLFYIFYSMPREEAQLYAAHELYVPSLFLSIQPRMELAECSLNIVDDRSNSEQIKSEGQRHARGWFYHKEQRLWLTRNASMKPLVETNSYERGSYLCFDPNTWETACKGCCGDHSRSESHILWTMEILSTYPGPPPLLYSLRWSERCPLLGWFTVQFLIQVWMDDDLKIFVLDSKHALVIGFDGSELINRYPLILTGFNTRRRWNPVVEKTDKRRRSMISILACFSANERPKAENQKKALALIITIIFLSINGGSVYGVQILSKSKLEKCEKVSESDNLNCTKKIILDMAVPSGSSGGEASIVAEVVEVEENSTHKMQTLRVPPTITVNKSAAYAVYEITYIRDVPYKPQEYFVKTRKCEPDASAKVVKICERHTALNILLKNLGLSIYSCNSTDYEKEFIILLPDSKLNNNGGVSAPDPRRFELLESSQPSFPIIVPSFEEVTIPQLESLPPTEQEKEGDDLTLLLKVYSGRKNQCLNLSMSKSLNLWLQDENGHIIEHTQPICCPCGTHRRVPSSCGNFFDKLMKGKANTAHCLRFPGDWFHVFGIGQRSLGFSVHIEVKTGSKISEVIVGPENRTVMSNDNFLKVNLIGDFAGYTNIPSFEDFYLVTPRQVCLLC